MDKNLNDGSIPVENKDTEQQAEYPMFKPELHKLEMALHDFSMAHSGDKDEDGDPLLGSLYIRGLYATNNGKLNMNGFMCGGRDVIAHALFEIIRSSAKAREIVEEALTMAKIESYGK